MFNGGNAVPDRRFTVKRYYFPVPKSQIEANANLVQNEGWN
ncbi:RagB/SusD family nutrient uptake outer membrane protein [Bacteroides caccae]